MVYKNRLKLECPDVGLTHRCSNMMKPSNGVEGETENLSFHTEAGEPCSSQNTKMKTPMIDMLAFVKSLVPVEDSVFLR